MKFKGKVALITGSSSGIGEAIANKLAGLGCIVVINSRKNVKGGTAVVKKIIGSGGEAVYFKADVSSTKDVKKLFKNIIDKYKKIDILINNAGESRGGEYEDLNLWKYQLENILLTQVIVTSEFLRKRSNDMRKIINISSIYGSPLGGNLDFIAYSAAKAAVNNMTVNLAKKLQGKVLVNAIAPGWTWTPPWGSNRSEEEINLINKLPIRRFVEPVEIAEMAASILINDAITGQIFTVDGGATLKDLY